MTTEKATFGAGCFWGVEAAFHQVQGVNSTAEGYMGGHLMNPTYRDVCTDQTGHAEVVDVTIDPSRVSYADLLKVFWENHDPTQFNRQGPDYGKHYRTAIFFHSPEQEAAAPSIPNTKRAESSFGKAGAFPALRRKFRESIVAPPSWSRDSESPEVA